MYMVSALKNLIKCLLLLGAWSTASFAGEGDVLMLGEPSQPVLKY